jgi:transposase
VSLGTIANLEAQMSQALIPAQTEALEAVRAADVKNVDETSWKLAGKLCWLWVAATSTAAAFLIHAWRGWEGLATLLGETIQGFVTSDRWSACGRLAPWCRQICWAHLKRDFQKLVDRGGPSKHLGQKLLAITEQVFEQWHLFRGGGFDRQTLQRRLDGPARELERLLRSGRRCADSKTSTFCDNVLGLLPAVWRFVVSDGVEPTNNHAERLLRRGVLWRKSSFGCASKAGCEFVARLLTVVQTRRLQGRSVLRYLYEALKAHRNGLPAPSLLAGR